MNPVNLKQCIVENFRNIQCAKLEFSTKLNCILGDNAQGKTNLLEALYILLQKKSFRKQSRQDQWMNYNGDIFEIYLMGELENSQIGVKFDKQQSFWSYNQQYVKSPSKVPKIPCIYVDPHEARSFITQTATRREWFDHQFSQLDFEYAHQLKRYEQGLKLRNALLAQGTAFMSSKELHAQLNSIDEVLITPIIYILQARKKLLSSLQVHFQKVFQQLFDPQILVELFQDCCWDINKQGPLELKMALFQQRANDIKAMRTTAGLHKVDFTLNLNGLNAYHFASLGQQKCAYLALIFAFVENFYQLHDVYPILFLDDISGELDNTRWAQLIQYLADNASQCFISTANIHFKNTLGPFAQTKIFEIIQGHVRMQ